MVNFNTDRPANFEDAYGRKREQELLLQHLLLGRSRVVLLTGPRGIGKTWLARVFAKNSEYYFSGGSHVFSAREFQFGARSVLSSFRASQEPALLTIDDLAGYSSELLLGELPKILYARPTVRLLLIGRDAIEAPAIDFHLQLPPLGRDEVAKYLSTICGLSFDTSTFDRVYAATAGNPRSVNEFAFAMRYGGIEIETLLRSFVPLEITGLVDVFGRPISSGSYSFRQIVSDISSVNDEIIAKLAKEPRLLYELNSRVFEELVAELLARLGYEVTLTPMSRDGGKDILAARRDPLGTFLFLIECKRFAPENRVGVSLVRNLYGVVQAERATAGILATTSFFTEEAKAFQRRLTFQMSLRDYFGVQEWLRDALRGST